jgi:hypothetical protein
MSAGQPASARVGALWSHPGWAVSILVLGGYAGIALAVHNLYPFSVFDMYSRPRISASRIVARDESGKLSEVERYDGWRCPAPVDVSPSQCGEPGSFFYTTYLDASRAAYIADHGASDGVGRPVDVVRRIWWLDEPGPPRITDCVLQSCSAVRR